MAKKKENTKQRYRKGGPARLDMREGGRVGFAKGGGEKKKKQPVEIEPDTKAKTEEEVTGTEKGTRRSRIKAKRTGRKKTRKAGRRAKKASLQAGATRSEARADKSSVKKATNEKGERTLEAAEKQEKALLTPKTSTQIQQTQSSDTRRPLQKWRDNRKKESTSSVGGGIGGGFVPNLSTEGGASVTGPVGTAASIESGRLIPSEAGQQLGGGIPVSGVPPEKQAPVMPAAPQKTIPTETKTGKDRVTTQPAALETGVTAGPEVVEEVTEEPVNPLLGGSELGNWGEEYDEHDIYKVAGDPNSGYLMDIWWVTADGQVGFTDEGWSRVPKADRSRIFRLQEEAHAMIQAYDQYKADLVRGDTEDKEEDLETGFGGAATASDERRARIERSATGIEAARKGIITDKDGNEINLNIPDAVNAGGYVLDDNGDPVIDPETGKPTLAVPDQDATESEIGTDVLTDAKTFKAGGFETDKDGNVIRDGKGNPIPKITGETVDTITADEMETAGVTGYQRDAEGNLVLGDDGEPIPLAASTYTAAEIDPYVRDLDGNIVVDNQGNPVRVAAVIPAQGAIAENSKAIATMQTQALSFAATGVTVDDDEAIADLQARVVGTIDDETTAATVVVAGTTIPKILRAKKQLRNAGLSESTIDALGNDITALEEELLKLTEAEKGMIEGLPEEAMVNVQLDALLKGMESGEIPAFAKPAVMAVNQMMAARGLDVSTVGRDALYNAIITSAIPIAQQNAQSIKESVLSQRTIDSQAAAQDAQAAQQTALNSADKVFNLNMAQFTADQNQEISNSKFLQTVTMTEASNAQQAVIQKAVSMAQLDLATLDSNTRLAAQNAQAFLQMDLTNLSNDQQAAVLNAQQEQQRLLSNQAADNAAKQFNAASENQVTQFMENLSAQTDQFNVAQSNAMEQFNSTQSNAAEARRVGREADIAKFNAQLGTQTEQFNKQQEFARVQWNAQNAATIEASNVQWRRQTNLADTAAQNQINAQNAQNAFNLSAQAQSFLWQELRDQADFDFRAVENEENRKVQIVSTAIANEGKAGHETYGPYLKTLVSSLSNSYTGGYTPGGT